MDKRVFKERMMEFMKYSNFNVVKTIDENYICSESVDSLYYSIPLIERLFLEVLKCIPDSNIEVLTQGTMKSINSLIENNNVESIFEEQTIKYLKKYYTDSDENGKALRTKLFEIGDSPEISLNVCFGELYYIILSLIEKLEEKQGEISNYKFEQIKMIT